jgi:hypothetical protein
MMAEDLGEVNGLFVIRLIWCFGVPLFAFPAWPLRVR